MKDLSIIITSFQRSKLLRYGLNSYLKQDLNFNYEILVINDGVEDDTEAVCKEFQNKLNIRYIFTGQRNKELLQWRVPAVAINIGAKLTEGKNIIISCSEIFLLNNCIKKISDTLNNFPNGIVIPEGKDDNEGLFLKYLDSNLTGDELSYFFKLPPLNTELPFFMGISKTQFEELNGYDEDFVGYCWEDADFVDRLKYNKCDFIRLPEKIIHIYHPRKRINLANIDQKWLFNQKMFYDRRGIVKRNLNRKEIDITGLEKSIKVIIEIPKVEVVAAPIEIPIAPKVESLINKDETSKIFTNIYQNNSWNSLESKSGTGSTLNNTKKLRRELVTIVNALGIDSMIDCPCGDFLWMKEIIDDLNIRYYSGVDIVEDLIKINNLNYSGNKCTFGVKNLIVDQIGAYDLIFCRDCLVHLSEASIKKVLNNFLVSKAKFIMLTTFTKSNRTFVNIKDGQWRPINLELAPFKLPEPLALINEDASEGTGEFKDKCIGLWEVEVLNPYLGVK
jgi:glycosyltransferase involved in cell wall biosynthesis